MLWSLFKTDQQLELPRQAFGVFQVSLSAVGLLEPSRLPCVTIKRKL